MKKRFTYAQILAMQTPAGGYSRATLRRLGVSWPPVKRWLSRYLHGELECKPPVNLLDDPQSRKALLKLQSKGYTAAEIIEAFEGLAK